MDTKAKMWDMALEAGSWDVTYHAFPDNGTAVCNDEYTPCSDARMSAFEVDHAEMPNGLCPACYTALTNPAPKGTSVAKIVVHSEKGAQALETIDANIERIATLSREGNTEGAKALEAETEAIISSLSGKDSVGVKKTKRDAMREALAAKPGAEVESRDYTTDATAVSLVETGAEKIREGVAVGKRMGDAAMAVAQVQFDIRARFTNSAGLPDLLGRSWKARRAVEDMRQKAKAGIAEDDVDALELHASLDKGVTYQMSTLLVDWLRALDTSDEETVREFFPMLGSVKNGKFTDAVYALYADKGISLPKESEREKKALRARELAEQRKQLEASEGDITATQPAEIMSAATGRIDRSSKSVDAVIKAARKLPAADRAKVKASLTELQLKIATEIAAL